MSKRDRSGNRLKFLIESLRWDIGYCYTTPDLDFFLKMSCQKGLNFLASHESNGATKLDVQ